MTSDKNRQIIEVTGIVLVVASLVFVGMQLYLDRQIAVADQYFNRAETKIATLRTYVESEAYFQYQHGLLPDEHFMQLRNAMKWQIESHEVDRNEFLGTSRPVKAVVREIAVELGL